MLDPGFWIPVTNTTQRYRAIGGFATGQVNGLIGGQSFGFIARPALSNTIAGIFTLSGDGEYII